MSTTRVISGGPVTAIVALALGSGLAGAAPAPVTDAATLASLDRVLAGEHRSEKNRARDRWRHPKETLEFFGFRRDMTVLEVWPGGGGWYAEVLAPALREHGRYIAADRAPNPDSQYVQDSRRKFGDKLAARPGLYDRATRTVLEAPGSLEPAPAGSVDMVLTFRNLHNWMGRDAADEMFKAFYAVLKPGGILGLVEHRGRQDVPQDPEAKSGYVREDVAIALAGKAGFELVGKSEINANPKDTKDHPNGVWSLPPTLRGGDTDRDKYLAIGESDRMTLRFRKPASAS